MDQIPPRTWLHKFADAFRGLRLGVAGQSSFVVHLLATVAVIGAAAILRMGSTQWCLLVLCITVVLAAEMFNSAIEHLAQAVDKEHNPELGKALDISAAAVLIAAIGAGVVGLVVFIHQVFIVAG